MNPVRERLAFVWSALRRGLPFLWSAAGLVTVLVGGSLLAALTFAFDEPTLAAVVLCAILLVTLAEGTFRDRRHVAAELEQRTHELGAYEAQAPQLSFGNAHLPTRSQPIIVFLPELGGQPKAIGTGRIIRVPVTNHRGAGEAREVHARLTFLPDDRDRAFSPRESAQGEWFSESGPEVEINLPGNGRPRLLDVLLVVDGGYPYAYEWTTASKHAALLGYSIKSNRVEVLVEVIGSGPEPNAPYLKDTLIVELESGHMIRAAWASADPQAPTNWVAWNTEAHRP